MTSPKTALPKVSNVLERERVFLLIDESLNAPVSTTRFKEIHRKTQGWISGILLLLGEIKENHLKNYSLKGYRFSVGRNMYCKKRFRRVNGYALIPELIGNIEAEEENNIETTRLVA
ncbi:MAG TPA: hypothetical protein ENI58_07350 [Nitrospirae bacterium]|nr:hypothetical protein [Nitrospirota bacterium]